MAATNNEVTTLFLASSRKLLFGESWPRIEECVAPLTEEQIWWRPNPASNSIGNLLLHLDGNVRQWIVDSFSQHENKRDRPAEFAAQSGLTGAELLARLGATLDEASRVLNRLTADDLLAPREIQGHKTRGLDAVYHVVEHFALHYGQIAYIAKSLTGKDLGFYKELNTTGRAD
jgi:uncharacterized damage-inducible protein DinB